MSNSITLPQWLDDCIFDDLKAKYVRSNSDMTVIDWDKSDILNYLGTYFPRSYAEAVCLFSELFRQSEILRGRENVSVFDFGCGTGGEIIGLLTAIEAERPEIKLVCIYAMDGNPNSLRLYEKVCGEFSKRSRLEIRNKVLPARIDDFYDLSIIAEVLSDKKFDVIMSFKAICEFVTKQQFEENNPYEHIAKFFLPRLSADGIVLLVDVTTYNDVSQEWLPKMMDKGLMATGCKIIARNEGYSQAFFVSHSQRRADVSKIAWRLIEQK